MRSYDLLEENFVGSDIFKLCLTTSLTLLVLANPPSGGFDSILTVNQKKYPHKASIFFWWTIRDSNP